MSFKKSTQRFSSCTQFTPKKQTAVLLQEEDLLTDDDDMDADDAPHAPPQRPPARAEISAPVAQTDAHIDQDSDDDSADDSAEAHVPLAVLASPSATKSPAVASKAEKAHPIFPPDSGTQPRSGAAASVTARSAGVLHNMGQGGSASESDGEEEDDEAAIAALKGAAGAPNARHAGASSGGELEVVPQVCFLPSGRHSRPKVGP
jgi:hypothetical protein